jgi:colanic acid biosynthesis protein WcaH
VIPDHLYHLICEHIPVLCVDMIIRNNQTGEILLVRRDNDPLKGEWWVVGGAVTRGEHKLEDACQRIANREIGIVPFNLIPIGYYSEFFQETPHGPKHTVSIVFHAEIGVTQIDHIKLDDQATEWKFSAELPERFRRFCTLNNKMFV